MKVLGYDVVASYKALLGIIILPISLIFYSFVFHYGLKKYFLPNNPARRRRLTLLFFFVYPLYAFSKYYKFLY